MDTSDNMYDPSSSPSALLRNNPMLNDVDLFDIDEILGFPPSPPEPNGELFPDMDSDVKPTLESSEKQTNFSSLNLSQDSQHIRMVNGGNAVTPYVIPAGKSSAPPSPPRIAPPGDDNATSHQPVTSAGHTIVSHRTPTARVKPERKLPYPHFTFDNGYNDRKPNDATLRQSSSAVIYPAKRGRPMKATSNSKQARYAREYREKNKLLMAEYEQRVMEQDAEITQLRNKNDENLEKLQFLLRQLEEMKKLIAERNSDAPVNSSRPAALIAGFLSRPPVAITVESLSSAEGVCVHIHNGEVSLAVCGGCNSTEPKQKIAANSLQPFNGNFAEAEPFVDSYLG